MSGNFSAVYTKIFACAQSAKGTAPFLLYNLNRLRHTSSMHTVNQMGVLSSSGLDWWLLQLSLLSSKSKQPKLKIP